MMATDSKLAMNDSELSYDEVWVHLWLAVLLVVDAAPNQVRHSLRRSLSTG